MGDDIFQYFTPRTAPTGGEEGAEGRGGENPGSPLGNFVQNLLTNMLGAGVDINPAAGQGGEGGEGGTRPMMLYGTMVDGNMRFRSMPPGSNMPGSMPAEGNEEGDATGTETPGEGERREGAGGTRGNNIARFVSSSLIYYVYGIINHTIFPQHFTISFSNDRCSLGCWISW
jgi:hypothetical protein